MHSPYNTGDRRTLNSPLPQSVTETEQTLHSMHLPKLREWNFFLDRFESQHEHPALVVCVGVVGISMVGFWTRLGKKQNLWGRGTRARVLDLVPHL
ncbi:hypothetical protein CDAR_2801 [Caerostris darwini]|uniref:Uncharacterized protein n=1 Tax=Caerostris darwini TaxID=1538125 RepID=A0AAV4TDG7_9ARAC|nr:hypothetical protein CDAR_2801 [Caerostris darwini]